MSFRIDDILKKEAFQKCAREHPKFHDTNFEYDAKSHSNSRDYETKLKTTRNQKYSVDSNDYEAELKPSGVSNSNKYETKVKTTAPQKCDSTFYESKLKIAQNCVVDSKEHESKVKPSGFQKCFVDSKECESKLKPLQKCFQDSREYCTRDYNGVRAMEIPKNNVYSDTNSILQQTLQRSHPYQRSLSDTYANSPKFFDGYYNNVKVLYPFATYGDSHMDKGMVNLLF